MSVSPAGRCSSMENFSPIGLRVLVVDDDPVCLMVLEKMLRQCKYKVTTCSGVAKALSLLRNDNASFDIVISDVYMPDEDGFKLLDDIIGLELDLPVIMMSGDGETSVVRKGIIHGACDYLIKPVRVEELRNIWQHVVRKHVVRRRRWDTSKEEHHGEWDNTDRGAESPESTSGKRKEHDVSSEDVADDISSMKKARVNWSVRLHQQFVNAVNQLGVAKAVPKRILEIMNVQGLTRENVASHLQKYRLYLKRLRGVIPEPCPVASFQASQDGKSGGYMQVQPGGKCLASSSEVEGLNLGAVIGDRDTGAGRRIDSYSMMSLAQYKTHRQKQAANRAQVLGVLELENVKQHGGNVSGTNSSRHLQRAASMDLESLLKPQNERCPGQLRGSADSVDDLATCHFKNAVKLEDMETRNIQANPISPSLLETPIAYGKNETELRHELDSTRPNLKLTGNNAVTGKMKPSLEKSLVSQLLGPDDDLSFFGQDYASTSSMTLNSETTFSDTSFDFLIGYTGNSDFLANSSLDVSDYAADFLHQQ